MLNSVAKNIYFLTSCFCGIANITLPYITMHHITLHCNTLHCIILYYIILYYIILYYIILYYIILYYIILYYIILYYIIFYYSTLYYIKLDNSDAMHCKSQTYRTWNQLNSNKEQQQSTSIKTYIAACLHLFLPNLPAFLQHSY